MKSKLVPCAVFCVLCSVGAAQYWTGPFRLTSDSLSDVNPSACKEFLPGDATVLVWQSNRNGNWDVYSRFGSLYNGNGWGEEVAVALDSLDEVNPVAACMNDWQDHPSYWCVWERRESPLVGSIWAAFTSMEGSWWPPVPLGRTIHTDGDSAQPSIIFTKGTTADTAWVVWRNHDTSGTYISCVCNAGDSWTNEQVAVAGDLRHARLGRCNVQYHQRPMLVWESAGDVWYSIRDSSGWRVPAQVAPSAYEDRNPDIVNSDCGGGGRTYVVWQSMRDGDTAAYIAAGDTFNVGQRVCDVSGAGRNWSATGTRVDFTTIDYWNCMVVWVTDRNGNSDIYASEWGPGDIYVDMDTADDLAPVLTCMGGWMGSQMAWVLWQSDRAGDWDIFGSFMYNSAIEEGPKPQAASHKPAATVVRTLPRGAAAFDAMGRRALNPMSGIYFVREAQAQAQAQALRKVVVER
jgi:hypothetical protein